ncbi:MAG: type-F conjugative transfer system secretin TraK [Nanopusillaceae archaeon]
MRKGDFVRKGIVFLVGILGIGVIGVRAEVGGVCAPNFGSNLGNCPLSNQTLSNQGRINQNERQPSVVREGKVKREVEGKERVLREQVREVREESVDLDKLQAMRDAIPGERIANSAFLVRPERATIVELSSTDINRISCSDEVNEMRVIFSKRKGVTVRVVDNNAFVEFEAKVERFGGEERLIFAQNPVEFYIFCDETIFNIIAFPRKIPAVTVYLDNKLSRLKKERSKVEGLPFEERLIEIIKSIMSGKVPLNAKVIKVEKPIEISIFRLKEIAKYVFEAEGFVARTFEVELKGNIDKAYVDLRERDFIRNEIVSNPLAISLSKVRLQRGERAMLVVIERQRVFRDEVGFYSLEGMR